MVDLSIAMLVYQRVTSYNTPFPHIKSPQQAIGVPRPTLLEVAAIKEGPGLVHVVQCGMT